MDEDLIKVIQEQVGYSRSMRQIGLSEEEAAKTTRFSAELLEQYQSKDEGVASLAGFRIHNYLNAPKNQPVPASELHEFADALSNRIDHPEMGLNESDLEISISLWSYGEIKSDDVQRVVDGLCGRRDFTVASESSRLLPIIGTDFIQPYLHSTELSETGGMGGPQKPVIREMAWEALNNYKAQQGGGAKRGFRRWFASLWNR